jgi:hypothetical protein
MPDFVPKNDAAFQGWLSNLSTRLLEYCEELALPQDEVTALIAQSDEFSSALADYQHQQTALLGALRSKQRKKIEAVEALRPLVRQATSHPKMTPKIRGLMKIPVPKPGPTRAGVGKEVPSIYVETLPGTVTIHFGTNAENELRNGKPSWAKGCNIYRRDPGEEKFRLLAFETGSPYLDKIEGPGADYTYMVEYRGRRASNIGGQSLESTVAARGALVA